MRSQLAVRLGVLDPQIVHLPPAVVSLAAAEEAIELADSYGICDGFPLDESQRFTLRAALGERKDGSWAAATVGDFEPRQNGKNDTCNARELAGLILFGEKLIIHTAHQFDTANESFLRLVGIFENWDDLRQRVGHIRYANGAQAIELLTGQRLMYKARTGGAGRGFAKAALIVYDEAQHLQAEHVAASGPAKLANPNNQSWYMGSGGLETSVNAWRMRRRALAGNGGRFAYVEHTAENVSLVDDRIMADQPDVLDREAWARANPAYGRRIADETLLSLFEELGPDLFARECMCIWDPEPGVDESIISLAAWASCLNDSARMLDPVCLAFDANPERTRAAIGACGPGGDGVPVLDAVDCRGGVDWLPARLVELRDKHRPQVIVCDPKGPAGSLLPELEALGIVEKKDRAGNPTPGSLLLMDGPSHAKACGLLFDRVTETKVRHRDQPELMAAIRGATKRSLSDAWAWDRRRSSVDITPLVVVTLALWAHSHAKPPPADFFTI